MRILVTDGKYKHTLGIVRCLGAAGHQVYVSSSTRHCLSSFSRHCGGVVHVPHYDETGFSDAFVRAVAELGVDLVIPVGTGAFKRLVRNRTQITERAQMCTVDVETLETALSKPATYALAERVSVPFPRTYRPTSVEALIRLARDRSFTYPCVVKSAHEMGRNVVVYANDAEELIARHRAMCHSHGFHDPEQAPIVQEYVAGVGCGFFAVYDRGRCGPTFQHRRLREMSQSQS